jgi:hypothetical protein
MQMYIFTYGINYRDNIECLHHSSDSSSLILLSISFLKFMRILVIAAFSLPSCWSAPLPDSVKSMAEVMGDKFSSLKVTNVRTLSYFWKNSWAFWVPSWKILLRMKHAN